MNNFTISRINTSLGIFRIAGFWCNENENACKIDITSIEIMGTDGWVLLNHASDDVISLIAELTPTLSVHLLVKST